MRRDPTTETPLFIPQEITEAYGEEASQKVSETWVDRPAPVRTAPVRDASPQTPAHLALQRPVKGSWRSSPEWAARQRLFFVFAVHTALVGWAVCTGWWAWLAYDTGSTTWLTIAAAGAVALLLGLVGSLRLWLQRD
ncbi:MAG TPA: hypothetical protein VM287_12400 [Egibacteraceae bacterium]|nr:hypothetical protein [Egibacteraceae bacterium]